jgi:hypothetical protein
MLDFTGLKKETGQSQGCGSLKVQKIQIPWPPLSAGKQYQAQINTQVKAP